MQAAQRALSHRHQLELGNLGAKSDAARVEALIRQQDQLDVLMKK